MTRHLDRPGIDGKSAPLIPLPAAAGQYRTRTAHRKTPARWYRKDAHRSGTVSHRRHIGTGEEHRDQRG